jgi:hypothetical protein
MNKFLKTFFIIIGVFLSVNFVINTKSKAAYVRVVGTYAKGTNCPESGHPAYVSVCGRVTQAGVSIYPGYDVLVAGLHSPGITVAVYSCYNEDPTCMNDALVTNKFNSTVTNLNGEFHLIVNKLDSNVTIKDGNGVDISVPRQSKTRWLGFWCGSEYAGSVVLKSYIDLNRHYEVACPMYTPKFVTEALELKGLYKEPPNEFDLDNGNAKLSNEMGVDTALYPEYEDIDQSAYNLASQIYFDNGRSSVQTTKSLKLEGADPRFDYYEPWRKDTAKWKTTDKYLGIVFGDWVKTGQWFSLDCPLKTDPNKFDKYCPVDETGFIGDGGDKTYKEWDALVYRERLYYNWDEKDVNFNIQNVLPGIPPTDELLFYREFTPRQDVTGVSADPKIFARYHQTTFSNIGGNVHLRPDNEDKEQDYIDCEILKKGVDNISDDKMDSLNSFTTGGMARGMANPAEIDKYIEENDPNPNMPVCRRSEDGRVITLGEIEPPDSVNSSGYELDKTYWNPEMILFYQAQVGASPLANDNPENSYTPSDTNETPWASYEEARDMPHSSGLMAVYQRGRVYPNNNAPTLSTLTAKNDYMEPWALRLTNPIRAYTGENEDWLAKKKAADIEAMNVGAVNLGYSEDQTKLGLYSQVNTAPAQIINTEEKDKHIYDNYYDQGNPDHYFDTVEEGETRAPYRLMEDEEGEKRTEFSGIYFTSAAWDRVITFIKARGDINAPAARNDALDSIITTLYGWGYVDWGNDPNSGLEAVWAFISRLFAGKDSEKSFLDRQYSNKTLPGPDPIESLVAEGFTVNEQNFKDLFALPCYSSGLYPENWGTPEFNLEGPECYRWHPIPFESACGTYKHEETCTGGNTNVGWDTSMGGVSRTCRVDECYAVNTGVECMCYRTFEGYDFYAEPMFKYEIKDCPASFSWATVKVDKDNLTDNCSLEGRFTCAQMQTTCLDMSKTNEEMEDCIKDTYEGAIESKIKELEETSSIDAKIKCEPLDWSSLEPTESGTVPYTGGLATPLCTVSRAGPYQCEANLVRNSPIKADRETIYEEEELGKIDMEQGVISDVETAALWSNPAETNFAGISGVTVQMKSSINSNNAYTSEKITTGEAGDNTAITRRANSLQFNSVGEEYEPIAFHCNNDFLGGSGNWDCPTIEEPEPPIVDAGDLNIDPSCGINIADPFCREAILGSSDLEFSETFATVMAAAGTEFKVSAAALLAYMGAINGANAGTKYGGYFTKEMNDVLYEASFPWYGTLGDCDDMEETAVGPWDWIFVYFSRELVSNGSQTALNALSEGRGTYTASRCNFLDSTYVLAATLDVGSCGASWESLLPQLKTMTFGSNPQGAYVEKLDNLYADDGWAKKVFDACRN